MEENKEQSAQRRRFIKGVTLGVGGIVLSSPIMSFMSASASGDNNNRKQLGIALVGLGGYSTNQLAPALQETENCYLAGIVTGTPSKIDDWKKKYDIPDKNVYNYENFDEIANNDDIDIVYVVLPNALHAEYVIRAAKAKKHVICEKPMATNVEDAKRMLDACNENGVQLAIGYRLHFEPYNKRVMELGQQQVFGKVKSITANNSSDMTSKKPNLWRLDKELAGGGSLMDLGIYAVQGAVYTMGEKPVAVAAKYGEVTKPTFFHDVEQSINWELEFEDGVKAKSNSSYAEEQNELSAEAENGWWNVSPAYAYEGKKGETSEGEMDYPNIFEQVNQMDSQAESFRNSEKSIVPGEMGLRDMKILMAIYESANAGGERVVIQY
ncbi:Gfo/Idh/MocA family oxidoreductase [Zunongwangia sp. F260]|uniref:Gfo/Idh/MocA family oxidoreductase n=1 Tax=Autumnicola lenta TaxID=3075593 RepID=A0ABU3CHF2_9FLAO|nr:Gfo/Idh/MocA family oxidoreductase [Zunongwangia sp. F260]MDT0645415.1 Gfo/Idh/MocA family oxidoreductase [Zunongwangia sp. F260]